MIMRLSILLFLPSLLWAQMGAMHLMIEPSPSFKGMGGIGVGLPSDDPTASYYNPANSLLRRNQSILITKVHIPYQDDANQQWDYNYDLITIYINDEDSHLQIAVGYHKTSMIKNTQAALGLNDQPSNPVMEHGPSFAIGLRQKLLIIPFSMSIGMAWKSGTLSFLDDKLSGKLIFVDIGTMLSFPFRFNLPLSDGFWEVQPGVGYSLSNSGFTDQPSPIDLPNPRNGRVGISLSGGAYSSSNRELLSFKYGRAVHDYFARLDQPNQSTALAYQSGLGDIDIQKNLIGGTGDENVTYQEGFEVGILGLVSIRSGFSTIPGENDLIRSTGLTLHLDAILFDLGRFFSIRPIYTFSKNFDLRYDFASKDSTGIMTPSDHETHLITLGLKNFW